MSLSYHVRDIRNVALAGHGAAGKTSLADSLLHVGGETTRRPSVDNGTSICDADDEERRRHFSIDAHLAHLTWHGKEVRLVDTPGYPDFIGNALLGFSAVENVLVAVAAPNGIEANTRRVFEEATRRGLGRFVVVTKMDGANVSFATLLQALVETFGPECVPFNVPIGEGPSLSGVIDVLEPPATVPEDCAVDLAAARALTVERIVETDDELMARYLEGEEIPVAELRRAACRAVAAGRVVPVVCLSTRKDVGLEELLNLVEQCGLSPVDVRHEIDPSEDGEVLAQVVKTSIDPFVGKLSVLKIHTGRLVKGATLVNPRTGRSCKVAHVYRLQGKTLEEIDEAIAGDLVAIPKFDDLHTSDVVTSRLDGGEIPELASVAPPVPMVSIAIDPKTRDDDTRLAAGLAKLAEEDPSFSYRWDERTRAIVVSGMSELHLDIIRNKLRSRFRVEHDVRPPHVPYLETVTAEAEGHYRHKKQTGGHGQFADVQLRVRPLARGSGFRFVDAVKGGVIPSQYIPAVEKGVREQMERGVVSGNPVVDVEVEVFFGSYHSVDSSEMAFKIAAAGAFKRAMEAAAPVILEPVAKLTIEAPLAAFGDVSADLATRRGHITGSEALPGGATVIHAEVPLAETLTYAARLSGMTSGQGRYTMELKEYQPVLPGTQQQLIEEHLKRRA